MAAAGKIDPMHQFTIAPLGSDQLSATPFQLTNSALWMLIVMAVIVVFMWGGLKRQLVPGRWQAAVEYLTGFKRRTTDARAHATTEQFMAWDAPTYDWPVRVDAPEGQSTTILRDTFGKPTSISRGGTP